jgi:hypothetical protein
MVSKPLNDSCQLDICAVREAHFHLSVIGLGIQLDRHTFLQVLQPKLSAVKQQMFRLLRIFARFSKSAQRRLRQEEMLLFC